MSVERLTARLDRLGFELVGLDPRPVRGRVTRVVGPVIRAILANARLGSLCRLHAPGIPAPLLAEVVGLDGDEALLAPLGPTTGLSVGAEIETMDAVLQFPVGENLLGRVVDGLGRPLDEHERGPLGAVARRPVAAAAPSPLDRRRVDRPLPLGVRAIDACLTCGEGQRLGIYGEPGAGKSTLLASLVRGAEVDVVVVALIGERGREVRDFIEDQVDAAARARCVFVVATSDRPPLERIKAAYGATTIAEAFRDDGRRVLLVMDSVTRFARALRDVGLAAGEPPTRRGFPPSVAAELPRLLERSGPAAAGSITALYTVLVEGDGSGDPIAEETRSILDGHVVLSPRLADAGHYPAIDILASRSRVMAAITLPAHRAQATAIRDILHHHNEVEFLVRVGEYRAGQDAKADEALARIDAVRGFLRQAPFEHTSWDETLTRLGQVLVGQVLA